MTETVWCPSCERLVHILRVVSATERVFGREVRAEVECIHGRLTFIGSLKDWAPERAEAS